MGLTYVGNEPVGKVLTIPLYEESYRLLTSPHGPLGDRDSVTWAEVGRLPLCLLTSNMQNRRIIDRALEAAGTEVTPTLVSNSMIVLYTHVKTGEWSTVMPAKLADTLGFSELVRVIPIEDSATNYGVGLVTTLRDPRASLVDAFMKLAREIAPTLQGA